jgi:hypothetical protein
MGTGSGWFCSLMLEAMVLYEGPIDATATYPKGTYILQSAVPHHFSSDMSLSVQDIM